MQGARDIILRYVCTEAAGVGKYRNGLAYGVLLPELAGTLGGKIGYGFFYMIQLVQALFGKTSAGADGLLVRKFFDGDAALALEFFPGTDTRNGHFFPYPTL